MKALILTAALPLLACVARAQDTPHVHDAPAETVKKAHAAAWLGIAMTESDKVVVGQIIPGGPADKAGLKEGDRILRIGDTAVEGQLERVREKVGQQKPGDTIELHFLRGDKVETIKIELAERPAELNGDFRGEFRREKVDEPRERIADDRGKTLEETHRAIERVKEEMKKEAGQLRLKVEAMDNIKARAEDAKKKLEDNIELDPYKGHGAPDALPEGSLGLEVNPDPNSPRQLLLRYLDSEWPQDKADGKPDDWELRLGLELPLFKWAEQNKKSGRPFMELKTKRNAVGEAEIWKRVQHSIDRALKDSGIGPDLHGKVMQAVEEARRSSSEKEVRRARLKAEAAKLEMEMQSLRERSDKVREELKKATE